MKSNPILEEVWRIKDQLAAESGYDMAKFFEQLRTWSAEHPHPGPRIADAEELRNHFAQRQSAAGLVREDSPHYGESAPKSRDEKA